MADSGSWNYGTQVAAARKRGAVGDAPAPERLHHHAQVLAAKREAAAVEVSEQHSFRPQLSEHSASYEQEGEAAEWWKSASVKDARRLEREEREKARRGGTRLPRTRADEKGETPLTAFNRLDPEKQALPAAPPLAPRKRRKRSK